jgi:[CysO sulfur-carrier protein]-S-L-cysteine hydrolase
VTDGARGSYDSAGDLRLPAAFRDEIVAHALADTPRECCGLLAGQPGDLDLAAPGVELLRLTNAAPGLDFYEMDADELFRVTRRLDEAERDIVAIYHSHPTGPARPSATDIELAFWPDAWYLICSLDDPARPDLRAFRIVDGAVSEADVSVV